MERCGTKDVEASGEDSSMVRCPTKSLKAAAAGEPEGLFAGFPTLGWAGKKTAAASDVDKAFAMAMVASAIAQQAMETAKKAAALAALASKEAAAAKEEAASKEELAAAWTEELAAAKQAEGKEIQEEAAGEEEAAGDDDTESEDEGDEMTSLEYIKTYQCLPPHEVELIIQRPLDRTPFTDSYAFKALSADLSATQEDFDLAYEEHEEDQDNRIKFRERVRSEYKANGYVTVSDEYVAMRIHNEELSERLWEEAFADYDEEVARFDNEVDVEEVAH